LESYIRAFVLLILLAVTLNSSVSYAGSSGSNSGSCSGSRQFGYFHAYTYQYAYIFNREVISESHTFSFSGWLKRMEHAQMVGSSDRHIIYSSGKISLAVPFKRDAGLYVRTDDPTGPVEPGDGWVKLCDY
jgi:hypothetical protein